MAQIGLKQLDSVLTGSLQVSGSVGVTGSLAVSSIAGDLVVPQYIKHDGDTNTYLNFTDDRLRFNIGGISYLDLNDAGSAPHDISFNDGANDVDLVIKGSSNNPLFKTDASTNRIGTHGKGTPEVAFHIGGSELRVDGNISGSATGTGSFGRVETSGSVRGGRFEIDGTTHYIDTSLGNMFVVTTGDIAAQPGTGKALKVTGGIEATTNITGSKNIISTGANALISGSSTSTGSFGRIDSSGRIFEQGSSVIDHATAMAIVFGG